MASIKDLIKEKYGEEYKNKLNINNERKTPSETVKENAENGTQPNIVKMSNDDGAKNQQQSSSARKNDAGSKGNQNSTLESRETPANVGKTNNMGNKTDHKNSHNKNRPQNKGTSNISSYNESSTQRTYPNNIEEFGEKFVNPYNFIRLGNRVSRDDTEKADFSDKLLTGSINCTLRTKTPIFIPNITNDNAFGLAEIASDKKEENKKTKKEDNKTQNEDNNEKHKNFDFFSYNDLSGKNKKDNPKEPIIPGSSIRGVIRSAFEALTDSCMMTSDRLITGRSKIPNKSGLIEKTDDGKWILYEADKVKINTYSGKKGEEYEVKIENDEKFIEDNQDNKKRFYSHNIEKYRVNNKTACDIGKNYNNMKEGFLVLGECDKENSNKKYDYFFKHKKNKTKIRDVTSEVALLEKVLDVYNSSVNIYLNTKENPTGYHYGYRNFKLDKKKIYPVWYSDSISGKIYLAPACISRIAFNNTITEILKNNGGYNACSDADKLCTACKLFGMVGVKTSTGSKIRFSDAKLNESYTKDNCYDDIMILDQLSSPKPTAVEFYTKRPKVEFKENIEDAHSWNYDYSIMLNGKKPKTNKLKNIEILGRKFYWHSHSIKAKKVFERNGKDSDLKISALNTTVRPVSSEVEFDFNIYFERITKEELIKLIWVLTIGENNIYGNKCHKIGGAKPLGFGSVKIVVNEVRKRTWNIAGDSSIIRTYEPMNLDELLEKELFSVEACKELLEITNFNSMQGKNVQYPFGKELEANGEPTGVENDEGGHIWFRLNRLAKNSNSTELLDDIKFVLNDILSKNHELPMLLRKKTEEEK